MTGELVRFEVADGVGEVMIDRPQRRNALSPATIAELRSAVGAATERDDVRVVLLRGAGDRAFCAGADLVAIDGGDDAVGRHDARGELGRLFRDMWAMGKPTIARVAGYALAGGFGLALACDFVVASDDAVFGTPEIDVGLWPYMVTVPMLRSMPPRVALDLMLTGRRIDAEEADRIGFLTACVPLERLDERVADLARLLASKPPEAVRLGRNAFYAVQDAGTEAALRYLNGQLTLALATADAREGRAAFTDKRIPRWSAP